MGDTDNSKQKLLTSALFHLHSAIELLDLAAAPGQIAAHVDLAANQLEDLVPATMSASFTRMSENGEGSGTALPF